MNKRQLRKPPYDAGGEYALQEPFAGSAFMSYTTARFTKKEDRDYFLAFVEYIENLAPKGFAITCAPMADHPWRVFELRGIKPTLSFDGPVLLEVVRAAVRHVEKAEAA